MKAKVLLIALAAVMHDGITYAPGTDNDTFECGEKEAVDLINAGVAKMADPVENKDPLLNMKKADLLALAQERKVTIPDGVKTNTEIIAFLNSPEGKGEA
ncbi:MAG: hypothetical protein PHV62_08330 [Sulfuricurvum sp.]|nr:hypothetical protein [Sulfuricurvum sp.]